MKSWGGNTVKDWSRLEKRLEKGLGKDWQFALYDEEDKEESLTKISASMTMLHELYEDPPVKYVVSDTLSPTTHLGDAALMRIRAFT